MTTLRAETAMSIFGAMDREGIGYAIVRNHREIPVDPGRDIDLLADLRRAADIEAILVRAKVEFGWENLVRCRGHHEGTSYYFLGPVTDSGTPRQLEIHFTRIRWAGATILDSADLVARRVRADSGLWVAAPEHGVVQRLLQQGLSGGLGHMKDAYWEEMGDVSRRHGPAVVEALVDVLGDGDLAARCVDAMARNDRAFLGSSTPRLRRAFLLGGLKNGRLGNVPSVVGFAARKRLRRRVPALCGVVVRVDPAAGENLVDRIDQATSDMFLESRRVDGAEVGTDGILASAAEVVSRAGIVFVATSEPFGSESRWMPKVSVWLRPDAALEEAVDLVVRRFVANHVSV